jgi:hypothetical protein
MTGDSAWQRGMRNPTRATLAALISIIDALISIAGQRRTYRKYQTMGTILG